MSTSFLEKEDILEAWGSDVPCDISWTSDS